MSDQLTARDLQAIGWSVPLVATDKASGFPLPPNDVEGAGAFSCCLFCAAAPSYQRCPGCPRGAFSIKQRKDEK